MFCVYKVWKLCITQNSVNKLKLEELVIVEG